ncbi:AraC family transcriptional regulator [Paenibacillus thalictri]|uniref:AraC family transcriptional regulator n=1 Tax=Paenibacillus thalictri TaxID=2527873 RepID=A0A4Q9DLM8_9BACL|nr:helix-turn-helix domain-containing protein [Paenibacillus thalictri]TBL76047.1 AraC family transcriptional regulator [Paenibacillus thalictri]
MRNRWYNRLLLSYFPIFIVGISTIVFITFFIVSEISKKEAERANQISTKYVTESIDSTLRGVEQLMLKELATNPDFGDFFVPKANMDARLVQYQASNDLKRMSTNQFLIHSIYLYRFSDQLVLTPTSVGPLEKFGDKDYLKSQTTGAFQSKWSLVRQYSEFPNDPQEKVITLSKQAMLPFGNEGIVVINIRVSELLRMVDEMVNSQLTFMEIWDQEGPIYPANLMKSSPELHDSNRKVLSESVSSYLGWKYVSGLKAGQLFGWVSFISYMWIGIGGIIFVLCIVYIVYITRRNYKPIELILGRIEEYQKKSLQHGKAFDEFSFIEKALESLIDQTHQYEKRFKEDLLVHRRQFFQELLEGGRDISKGQWQAQMKRLNLEYECSAIIMSIAEIDNYSSFAEAYSERDQHLLKFALTNVVQEFARQDGLSIWAEWISKQRLGIMYVYKQEPVNLAQVVHMSELFREWVETNLKISITVGIGSAAAEFGAIRNAFLEAELLLRHKLNLGSNKVIAYNQTYARPSDGTYEYYQRLSTVVQYFRLTNEAWTAVLGDIFRHMAEEFAEDEAIRGLLDYLLHLLQRELTELPDSLKQVWDQEIYPSLCKTMAEAESLDVLAEGLTDHLLDLYRRYIAIRESKGQMAMLAEMRQYIEINYANPDLSLAHLSDKFDVNAKYVSQLFKEQFGMKFVDFLVNLRMEEAKRLLLASEDPIQDIAEKVGYTHGISFGRTFKKVVGTTPGDYRKMM